MTKSYLVTIIVAFLVSGCVSADMSKAVVYHGDGSIAIAGPLGLGKTVSFRFVEKWRISHKWLTGPIEIRGCKNEGNPLSVSGPDALKSERGTVIIERDGRLYELNAMQKDGLVFSRHDELFYGTPNSKTRENDFQGYTALCGHYFRDTLDGVAIYLVKPDPAKGTDEWIRGATPVTINGQRWLRKIQPIEDWWLRKGRQNSGPVETWVLQIPETPYWFSLHMASSTGETSPYKTGAFHYPEKHRQIVDLFHEMVASVTLEPITPIDIPAKIKLLQ